MGAAGADKLLACGSSFSLGSAVSFKLRIFLMETAIRPVLVGRANDAMGREQLGSRTDLLVAQRGPPRRHGWPLSVGLSAAGSY